MVLHDGYAYEKHYDGPVCGACNNSSPQIDRKSGQGEEPVINISENDSREEVDSESYLERTVFAFGDEGTDGPDYIHVPDIQPTRGE